MEEKATAQITRKMMSSAVFQYSRGKGRLVMASVKEAKLAAAGKKVGGIIMASALVLRLVRIIQTKGKTIRMPPRIRKT